MCHVGLGLRFPDGGKPEADRCCDSSKLSGLVHQAAGAKATAGAAEYCSHKEILKAHPRLGDRPELVTVWLRLHRRREFVIHSDCRKQADPAN